MKLSKAQREVVDAMKSGLFVWTNEGNNLKAWLGDENAAKRKSIRLITAETLFNKGVIKTVDGDYRQGLFKYELAKS